MNLKLLYGGGGNEDSISKLSKDFIKSFLTSYDVEEIYLNDNYKEIISKLTQADFVIPCIHGRPGESGELIAALELLSIPFLGCGSYANFLCFDKVQTKLFLEANGINTTPFIILNNESEIQKAEDFFEQHDGCFVKASSEGSSVGCYLVEDKSQLNNSIQEAFKFSDKVLVEKIIRGREVEVATFEYHQNLHSTQPGEILIGDSFYSYDQKYSEKSQSTTIVKANNIPDQVLNLIDSYAQKIFKVCKLKDLSRIDFFIEDNQLYVNEINTFPGMTSISLFPKMLESHNICTFKEFLKDRIEANLALLK